MVLNLNQLWFKEETLSFCVSKTRIDDRLWFIFGYFPGGGVFSGFGKSRDRKEYPNKTKPNIYRNGFENFRIVELRSEKNTGQSASISTG